MSDAATRHGDIIRQAASDLEAATAALHAAMRDASADGVPTRPIANASGLSIGTTHKILNADPNRSNR